MSNHLEAIRPLALSEIESARARIAGTVLRTPLVPLDLGEGYPKVYLKLENLQPTNSYKLRGAVNAVAMLSEEERRKGVWTISAGNAGQGVAYAARAAGIPCTVVVIETAPAAKMERMKALGAHLIPVSYDAAWVAMEARQYPGAEGTFIHPFDEHNFIVGHATMGLEILEDLPDVAAVVMAIGGGGLITAVGSTMKLLRPDVRVLGVEPETAAPAKLSFESGSPQVFPSWTSSFVDGAGGKSVFPRMWTRMKPVVDATSVVALDQVRVAVRTMAEKTRVISEGAGALPLAAVLAGQIKNGPVVAVVSGGNIDREVFIDCLNSS
ncbi:pyridoxal-5'-phosphate-dependent enzyme, beta subunit [Thozetella sp. PMI_491]|nr:pyridoxal-5'-phosphate-dependent enzyme, beta subunit [Thozetella sp. PMI_491]